MCKLFQWFFKKRTTQKPIIYDYYYIQRYDYDVCNEINKVRKEKGLKELRIDTSMISDIAGDHIEWLNQNITTEEGFPEKANYGFQTRINQINLHYPNTHVGECVAAYYNSPESVVKAWEGSERHHEVMMKEEWTHVAVGSDDRYCVTLFTNR